MSLPVSPLAPASFPELPPVPGVRIATGAAGLRYKNRDDLLLIEVPEGTIVAGAFTRSLCPSAPVDWCRDNLRLGAGRALVVNSGNANAFTGKQGEEAVRSVVRTVSSGLGVSPPEVFMASTGVIGEQLPVDRLNAEVALLPDALQDSGPAGWVAAAGAIRTTDTFAKGAAATADLGGAKATIVGIAKGSGMIAPDMATMLSFVFTDAALSADVAQSLLSQSVTSTYNRITVDSDTSTSDTVLWFATGSLANDPIASIDDPRVPALRAALDRVNLDLAHQIVRDGEGATKFVEVTVTSAESDEAASTIALAIANSPLVKTALAAEDANWGRIVMAVGKAGQRADRDALSIWIGDEQCAEGGMVRPGYSEAAATEHLKQPEVRIRADVGVGQGHATVWTCDLTHGYIDINAGYRS
ncbi:MAG: bifunctional glutamate N-acetyltransferase/amino-acid acetyltransferase ArgJ [Actinomycetota bacterium]|nr:bifunctional glutamate N-acetyltransferase/amino-acid acetyltransferase ArgJ [Actinomycetota bacterium]